MCEHKKGQRLLTFFMFVIAKQKRLDQANLSFIDYSKQISMKALPH